MIWSIAVPVPSRMACMCSKKACSVLSGRSLMVERPVWLVTPRGRIGSHSGCTVVLVDGTTMPIRLRNPKVSGTGGLRISADEEYDLLRMVTSGRLPLQHRCDRLG